MPVLDLPLCIDPIQASRLMAQQSAFIIQLGFCQLYAIYRFNCRPCPKPNQNDTDVASSTPKSESVHKSNQTDSNNPLGSTQQRIDSIKTNVTESQKKVEDVRNDIGGYAFDRVFNFTEKYAAKLEHRFPKAVKAYRLFTNGFKTFFKDFSLYAKYFKELRLKDLRLEDLSRKDLELYYWMPQECRKLMPMLVVSTLPFAQYVILPIA